MRWLLLAVLLATGLWLAGCGGVTLLTGGSIPIGDVDGRAYLDVESQIPAPFTTIELQNASGQVLQTTQTDVDGIFSFTGVPAGKVVVDATVGTLQGTVGFNRGSETHVRVGLLLTEIDSDITTVRIVGPAHDPDDPIEVSAGTETQFTAQGEDAGGQVVEDLAVSWALVGDLGDLLPNGKLKPNQAGDGELVAQYGSKEKTEKLRVNAKKAAP